MCAPLADPHSLVQAGLLAALLAAAVAAVLLSQQQAPVAAAASADPAAGAGTTNPLYESNGAQHNALYESGSL